MTDHLLQSGRTTRLAVPRVSPVTALYVVTAAFAAAGLYVACRSAPTAPFEWQLSLLLRFMAAVKTAMLLGAIGLTHWRLRQSIGTGLALGYIGGIALMSVAPPLIWSLAHVALGAGLFHAGLLTFLVAAWRDDAPDRLLSRMAGRR